MLTYFFLARTCVDHLAEDGMRTIFAVMKDARLRTTERITNLIVLHSVVNTASL